MPDCQTALPRTTSCGPATAASCSEYSTVVWNILEGIIRHSGKVTYKRRSKSTDGSRNVQVPHAGGNDVKDYVSVVTTRELSNCPTATSWADADWVGIGCPSKQVSQTSDLPDRARSAWLCQRAMHEARCPFCQWRTADRRNGEDVISRCAWASRAWPRSSLKPTAAR